MISVLTLSSHSCSDDNYDKDCDGIACTNEFRSIGVSIKDSAGEPVLLDSYKAILEKENRDIAPELTSFAGDDTLEAGGNYLIFNDQYVQAYENNSTKLKFIGIKDSKEIIVSEFVVGADCCHVSLISGDTSIVLD